MKKNIETPFASFNEAMGGGFQKGRFSLITGFTGFGKTAIACQLAGEFASKGHRGLYLTLDEGAAGIIPRLYSNLGGIPYADIRDGESKFRITEGEMKKIEILSRLLGRRLIMRGQDDCDVGPIILSQHLSVIVDQVEQQYFPLDFVVIDFLTAASSGWRSSMGSKLKESMMREMGGFLSDFSKRKDIAVVATAQTNPYACHSKYVSPYHTAYSKRLAEAAQFCICMSSIRVPEDDIGLAGDSEQENIFKKEQDFSMHDGCGRLIKRVPMIRELKYQRFKEAVGSN